VVEITVIRPRFDDVDLTAAVPLWKKTVIDLTDFEFVVIVRQGGWSDFGHCK
jgi:hypothetical protein